MTHGWLSLYKGFNRVVLGGSYGVQSTRLLETAAEAICYLLFFF